MGEKTKNASHNFLILLRSIQSNTKGKPHVYAMLGTPVYQKHLEDQNLPYLSQRYVEMKFTQSCSFSS